MPLPCREPPLLERDAAASASTHRSCRRRRADAAKTKKYYFSRQKTIINPPTPTDRWVSHARRAPPLVRTDQNFSVACACLGSIRGRLQVGGLATAPSTRAGGAGHPFVELLDFGFEPFLTKNPAFRVFIGLGFRVYGACLAVFISSLFFVLSHPRRAQAPT
jgi:hypothetical protein